MMRVTIAEPRDYDAILRLWASALPVDWIGRERFYTGLLCDPAFRDDSLWVAKTRGRHVVGFALISAPTPQGRKMGAIAVEAAYRGQGIGTRLWHAVCATVNPAESLRVDGIFPHVFIPGVDRTHYAPAWQWFLRRGCQPEHPIVAMERLLDDTPIEPQITLPKKLAANVYVGILPRWLRHRALETARSFGSGWERAVRETWQHACRPERVLGIYTATEVLGISVVGGYGEPLGRLGPIGVVPAVRGQGWGKALLQYTLRYMRTHAVSRAYFLHCVEGSPAYHLYRHQGFHVIRTFVPMIKYVHNDPKSGNASPGL
ncbi:MAG: hypothetical protein C7B47_11815 [Sulfobacillus thermosulfidooxidans]|uniref:N-acetyltransferase domain-containing protein n=1 Tax=Sulfobacillus thermosulfidooxidans TaxID=28034 RepID=A0A2T2WTJ5_SULTH|nr:MAG: hypothetical protein C7B47_11815 [Sulfobacillus thermosulfidooxidans]